MAKTDTQPAKIQAPADHTPLRGLPYRDSGHAAVLPGVRAGTAAAFYPRSQSAVAKSTQRIPPETYAKWRAWYVRYLWIQYRKRQRLELTRN